LILTAAAIGAAAPAPQAQAPPRWTATECFPFERLEPTLRAEAETLLLRALDGEALYTIAGGLKPMSSGFVSASITVSAPDLGSVETARRVLSHFTCGGELAAGVHHFAQVYEGRRAVEAVVFHRPALQALLTRQATLFAPFALSPSADPMEVVMAVEYAPAAARLRGYGYLFGYPDYAVDFFVQASETQREQEAREGKGDLVPRDFLSLPTFRGERRFVYAVPKGHTPNAADDALRAAAEAIYADYAARRTKHITGASASGVLTLVREWFDDGTGDVRPSHARTKTAVRAPASPAREPAVPIR
jgi:hypothetical protein